eukprot:TRINITY_DN12990_c0_g3_i1.p1 TRINITY_DN12990_c0_g3~~TRINITY_DN12990_c0_g3_i1.p1  ORF type:complete len:221 (-),score=49.57 TRINITY_DN12990_c0_g3_i1:62-724(-)
MDQTADQRKMHRNTQLCKFHAVGACTRGDKCSFAHSKGQLRDQPDFSKTRLCMDFMELGRCQEAHNCKFAHGVQELRPSSALKVASTTKQSTARHVEEMGSPVHSETLRALKAQQFQHEQAALKLLFKGLAAAQKARFVHKTHTGGDEDSSFGQIDDSLSRQTTSEGFEPLPPTSRSITESSQEGLPAHGDVEMTVKNTFIHIDDVKIPFLRRTCSAPAF